MAGRNKRSPTAGRGDYSYLIQPRGDGTTWYANVAIPRALRIHFGGRKALVRSLGTTNIHEARAARWGALKDLKAEIERVQTGGSPETNSIHREALKWREYLARDIAPEDREIAIDRVIERAEEITHRSSPIRIDEPEPASAYEARSFFDLATGRATPISTYIDRWLGGSTYTERTKADARTALAQLEKWCADNQRPAFLERIDDRAASDFRDHVLVGKVHWKTANKKLSLLRQYWAWLESSFTIKPNPWTRKSFRKVKPNRIDPGGPDARERPFSDDEIRRLLAGDADVDLVDLMRISALSGMRLDEIGRLRVADCQNGNFHVRRGKTEAAVRSIPIHPNLRTIVKRRAGKRSGIEFLFLDLSDTGWDDNRTMAVSKRFTYYRRKVGIDDRRPGARRSKVNFHSFRRWFATKAEDAGNPQNVVAALMGHEKGGITFDLYSQAELTRLKKACIESVKLPRPARSKKQIVGQAKQTIS